MNTPIEHPPEGQNNSGKGRGYPVPPGVAGWSWGAFLLNWIWAIGNRTWIGLLTLIPYLGLIMAFVLGFKGREWAWQNKSWKDVDHFHRVQRLWSIWGIGIVVGLIVIPLLLAIVIPNVVRSKSPAPKRNIVELGGFCGASALSDCKKDDDCQGSGCSGQVCAKEKSDCKGQGYSICELQFPIREKSHISQGSVSAQKWEAVEINDPK